MVKLLINQEIQVRKYCLMSMKTNNIEVKLGPKVKVKLIHQGLISKSFLAQEGHLIPT